MSSRLWIVTGAAGFVGSVLVRRLVDRGERVRVLLRSGAHPASLHGLDIERMAADVLDATSLEVALAEAGPEAIVVHAAGRISIEGVDDPLVHRVNVDGTANLIAACRAAGVRRLVYVSSVHALPVPADGGPIRESTVFDPAAAVGDYAASKAEASALVLAAADLEPVLVHPSGVIGPGDPGDGALTRLVRDGVAGRLPATVPGGYDFVDVRDVADGIVRAAERGRSGEGYLLAGGHAEVSALIARVCARVGRRPPPRLPMALARAWAPLGERIARFRGKAPLFTAYSLRTLASGDRFDASKARRDLAWRPRPLEATIDDMTDWVRVHG